MHKLLNDYLTVEDDSSPAALDTATTTAHFTDVQQLKHFAVEAELNQNYDLAAYYYQEVGISFFGVNYMNFFLIAHGKISENRTRER